MENKNTITNDFTSAEYGVEKLDIYSEILPSQDLELQNVRYGFVAAGVEFLIRKDMLSEVSTKTKVFPIPHAPSSIHGLINHRGNLIPVFKFRTFIRKQAPVEDPGYEYILVLDSGQKSAAFYIDKLPFTINAEDDEFVASESSITEISSSAEQFIDNVYEINNKVLLDFNFDRFFYEITLAPS